VKLFSWSSNEICRFRRNDAVFEDARQLSPPPNCIYYLLNGLSFLNGWWVPDRP